jgi:hypothetical protein
LKKRIVIASVIAAVSVFVYPFMEHLAQIERGHSDPVFGGEEMLLIFGLFVSLFIILDGLQKRAEKQNSNNLSTAAVPTESEQSGEHTAMTHN